VQSAMSDTHLILRPFQVQNLPEHVVFEHSQSIHIVVFWVMTVCSSIKLQTFIMDLLAPL